MVISNQTDVTYSYGSGNTMNVNWTDNSNNETSFRLRRSYEEYDLVFAGNTNEVTFDLDTMYASAEIVPFFMVADFNGDWSEFSDTSEYSMPDKIVEDYNNGNSILAYPNPVTSILNIDLSGVSGNPENFVLTNINGIELFRMRIEDDHIQINTEQLPHGVYIITIGYGNGIAKRLKFSK